MGITLKLWPQDCVSRAEDKCCGPQAVSDARAVCHTLGIPYYLIDEAAVEAMIGQPPPKASGSLHDIQRASVLAVHAETAGNISETARRLGISRNTVYRILEQFPEHTGSRPGDR